MMGLLGTARAYWAGYKFKRSPLGQALALHTQEFFYRGQALSHFSQENKDRLVQDFYSKVVAIGATENPAMACRELLAEYVLSFCGLAVLCLKEEEKAAQFYAENPYISGAIWRHVERAVENNEEMAQTKWANPDFTAEDLVAFANTRSALMLYYANGLNMVRMELGDRDPQKDWFRPFVEAMMVVEEDRQREKLGLEQLCPGVVRSLPYSVFLNLVVDGARQPFYEWTKQWPDRYLSGEGPLNPEPRNDDLERAAPQAN
ncbi:hypothetical protein [Sphingomonas lacusdianchii]|uniref:hypothetical protein n=1 Tax=Sphingomonas lacusdianchii TaxID=2917992 RepID=UPI001F596F93|nr:hypothetical protein [Sphingomonas sp. JXJ CY 53]